MKYLLFLFMLYITSYSFSQEKLNLVFRLSDNISKVISDNLFDQFYNDTKLDIGIKYNFKQNGGTIEVSAVYDLSGSIHGEPVYAMRNHFLGGKLLYYILPQENRFRCYLGFSVLSEIYSNYRNRYLKIDEFTPTPNYYGYSGSNSSDIEYTKWSYKKTPLILGFILGCSIKVNNLIHINVGAGYNIRKLNYEYSSWTENENQQILGSTVNISKERIFHYISFELGISYSFPFHKEN